MYGCMAQVWVIMENQEDKFYFRGDSDAAIVKGLVSIITEALSGHTSGEIKNIKQLENVWNLKDFQCVALVNF